MKRIIIGLLISLTTLSITGCGQANEQQQTTSSNENINKTTNIKEQETEKDSFVLTGGKYVVGDGGFKQGVYDFEATKQAGILNVYRDGKNIYAYGLGTDEGIEICRKAGVENIDKFGNKVGIPLANGDIVDVPDTLTLKATIKIKVIENK